MWIKYGPSSLMLKHRYFNSSQKKSVLFSCYLQDLNIEMIHNFHVHLTNTVFFDNICHHDHFPVIVRHRDTIKTPRNTDNPVPRNTMSPSRGIKANWSF